jgi:hypothetical protein
MRYRLPTKRNQEGSVLVVALIVLVGLMSLGAMAVLSARMETRTGSLERSERVALYAAEAGIAVAQEYLRSRCDSNNGFNPLDGQMLPRELPNNADDKPPLSDPDAKYDVIFYQDGDCDGVRKPATTGPACVAIRSRGEGPGGATALIKVKLSHPCLEAALEYGLYSQESPGVRIPGGGGAPSIADTGTETTALPAAGP